MCGIIEGDSTTALVIGDNKELYFDVIIDDGMHARLAQLKTFKNFYPLLNPGGTYIIEDMLDS